MRQLDALSAADQGVSEYELMRRAGAAAVAHLRRLWPAANRFAVLCGTGNNGGDGWVVARLLHAAGLKCDAYLLGDQERIQGPAREAFDAWQAATGLEPRNATTFYDEDASACPAEILIDALVGIGIKGSPRESFDRLVERVNLLRRPVLSLDAPSGLNTDTGAMTSAVISATVTLTFIALKPGLLTGRARNVVGDLLLEPLGTAPGVLEQVEPTAVCLPSALPDSLAQPRARAAHKGDCGHVLVVGGNAGMGGAAILAAGAALRGGAGLVTLATRAQHVAASLVRHPEVMAIDIDSTDILSSLCDRASAIVVGPGLGQDAWAAACIRFVLESDVPAVIDADAINLLARHKGFKGGQRLRILTPHPGEAARLAGCSVATIESDRVGWATRLAQEWDSAVILKGAGTVVDSGEAGRVPRICAAGNPGMATGGMGDVLAGLLGALLAQGYSLSDAAEGGVYAHAAAADIAWKEHGIGLTAGDVLSHLGRVLTPALDSV